MTDTQLSWKRQPDGTYLSRHGFWVFEAGRQETSRGTGWYLKGWPEGNPERSQRKEGFSKLELAKRGVTGTLCHRCMRHRLFSEVEPVLHARPSIGRAWRCRDHESCKAASDAREARKSAELAEALVRQDHERIWVRDADTGPDLVFRDKNHNQWSVQLTPADLDKTIEAIMAWKDNR